MLIDSHCHLDRLERSPDDALADARAAGVQGFLCVAIDLDNIPDVLAIADAHDDVWASVGVHPLTSEGPEPTLEQLVTLAEHPKVVAIGETGLDYHYAKDDGARAIQRERFATHLRAAAATGKPVIIHTRDAKADTLALLREHPLPQGGVLHCFTEDWPMASAAIELGYYISFSGIVTFRNAEALREVARQVPPERLLVETDSPYLAPVPHRGKSNEPRYVIHVAQRLAQERGESEAALIAASGANCRRLFAGMA